MRKRCIWRQKKHSRPLSHKNRSNHNLTSRLVHVSALLWVWVSALVYFHHLTSKVVSSLYFFVSFHFMYKAGVLMRFSIKISQPLISSFLLYTQDPSRHTYTQKADKSFLHNLTKLSGENRR